MTGLRLDPSLRAVAGPYRRRRGVLRVGACLALIVAPLLWVVPVLHADDLRRFDVLMESAGCEVVVCLLILMMNSERAVRFLDRAPIARSHSRLAHHALRLRRLVGDADQSFDAMGDLCEIVPAVRAVAHAARSVRLRLADDTPAQMSADALAVLADGLVEDAAADLTRGADDVLALTRLAVGTP